MKMHFLRLFPFLLIAVFSLSCSSEENGNDQSNDIETIENSTDISLSEIFNKLETAEFPQNWNEEFLDSGTSFNGITLSPEEVNKLNYMDYDYEGSDATFLWKYETSDWKLMCIRYFFYDANYYWLMTLNEDFGMIDEVKFAADEAVRVENEFGGTSSGIEYYTAVIELKEGTVSINSEEGNFILNKDGKFSKIINKTEPIPLKEFSNLFKDQTTFPLKIDSAFIEKNSITEYNKLNAGQVMTLFKNGKDIANIWAEGTVEIFIMIDSVKQTGTFDEFVQRDEPGETEESDAFAMFKTKMPDATLAYIWCISDATQEMGGPHSSGTIYYISFVKNDKVINSYPIAEFAFGGDSPMWGETKISAEIFKTGEIKIYHKYIEGDDDEGTVNVTKKEYKYIYEDGKLADLNKTE